MPDAYTVDAAFPARRRFYEAALTGQGAPPASTLSISGICEAAGRSRSTFYRHFGSIDGFLSRFLDDLVADAMLGMPPALTFYQAVLLQCGRLTEDPALRRLVASTQDRELVAPIARQRMRSRLAALAQREYGGFVDEATRLELDTLAACLPSMLFQWVASGAAQPPAAFAAHLQSCIPERLLFVCDGYL